MADRKISDLTALTTPASGDFLPIVDISEAAAASKNKRITIEELMRGVPDGTAAAPGIAFETDSNTGIFSPGADQLAISTGGTARLTSSTTALTSALPVDVPLGAAATPSLTFTGDLNTGIYSPGANQLAVATNGAGRLFVDASGNVGINAASPAGRLGVDGAVVIGNQLSTGTTTGTLRAVQSTSSVYLQTGLNTTAGSSADLVFSNINASNEWMRLTAGGRLGIGNSSPDVSLHVKSAGSSIVSEFEATAAGFSSIDLSNTAGYARLSSIAGNLALSPAGTERLRIDSSGRLLVGTSSNSGGALFQVNGDRIRVGTAKTPATSGATGTTGEIAWDADYIYVCTATNTWKRSAIATW